MLKGPRYTTFFGDTCNERQADSLLRILMDNSINNPLVFYFKIELFTALARKSRFWRFTRFDLTAHELP